MKDMEATEQAVRAIWPNAQLFWGGDDLLCPYWVQVNGVNVGIGGTPAIAWERALAGANGSTGRAKGAELPPKR
jgi:hypothetical protein